MIDQSALTPHAQAELAGYAAPARRRRTRFWAIVLSLLLSLALWALLIAGASALWNALAG